MQTKYKVVVGSLVGAAAIHAAFVACGDAAKTGAQGADGGLFDAMRDVIADIVGNETHDAVAGVDAGSCGCTVSGMIQNTPASEAPAQLKRGSLSVDTSGSIVVSGPFVLTDATPSSSAAINSAIGANLVVQPAGATCAPLGGAPETDPGYVASVFTGGGYTAFHGARYMVPAGQMLCAFPPPAGTGQLQWAGFVPYQ